MALAREETAIEIGSNSPVQHPPKEALTRIFDGLTESIPEQVVTTNFKAM